MSKNLIKINGSVWYQKRLRHRCIPIEGPQKFKKIFKISKEIFEELLRIVDLSKIAISGNQFQDKFTNIKTTIIM